MPCKHRFYKELIPEWKIEHLFVGTFNPEWNENNAVQADYFYGRKRNNFWSIIAIVFGNEDLKHKSKAEKLFFLKNKKIGLTDLILNVKNANSSSEVDIINLTKKFSDNVLNTYELEFNTNSIIEIIKKNKSIKGVYLTRSTLNGINQVAIEWNKIAEFCKSNNINYQLLRTPANYGGGSVQKSIDWISKINI